MSEIITASALETQKVGQILAEEIIKSGVGSRQALTIALQGDLGSGKTTFIQGLAKGLKIKDKVTSPTFVILRRHNIQHQISNIKHLYHLDCYRIRVKDLAGLDFREIIKNPQNMIVIEWAERIKKSLPSNLLWIKFAYLNKHKRKILIK